MRSLKDIASFLYPQLVEVRKGTITPYLEIRKSRGKYILNSITVNYSFGGAHLIFEQLFRKINIQQFDFKNVLILGMGAGSVISLLRVKYRINCSITAVENDQVVLELAEKYFDIRKYRSLDIISGDAYRYVCETKEKYDLIISDIFVDADVPKIFASSEYLLNLKRISNERCCIIYNKMTEQSIHKKELGELSQIFDCIFPGSQIHRLFAYGSENSLLFYNTLPVRIEELNREVEYNPTGPTQPVFKPSFQWHENQIEGVECGGIHAEYKTVRKLPGIGFRNL
jgi:spermidine synthase